MSSRCFDGIGTNVRNLIAGENILYTRQSLRTRIFSRKNCCKGTQRWPIQIANMTNANGITPSGHPNCLCLASMKTERLEIAEQSSLYDVYQIRKPKDSYCWDNWC